MLSLSSKISRQVVFFKLILVAFYFLSFVYKNVLDAAPISRNRYYEDENTLAIREMRDSVDRIRYDVNNQESEIRTFDERLKNLDLIIENVREELLDTNKSHKDLLKSTSIDLEGKIYVLESQSKGMITDLKLLRTHANDTASILTQFKQKLSDIEKSIDLQNQNVGNLQAALRSIMSALEIKNDDGEKKVDVSIALRTYSVKAGDTLEKIARSQETSVQVLKELNKLNKDRIVVGQILSLPEK